ncbi:hypothetical protein [Brevibacillus brevis]|uniref:hypothetical protein n=1 Tax=Brevibacillus brevis TaxID=1393 RepID=UPI00163C5066|nr:hypothetical protein [Lysinibacillus sp. SDF0063]
METQHIDSLQTTLEMARMIEESRIDDFALIVTWFEPERTVGKEVLGSEETA